MGDGSAQLVLSQMPETKAGLCVSTISIVCRRTGHLRAKSTTYRTPGLVFRARFAPTFTDAADGADAIFERCAHPNESASGSTFTTEGNLDAERPKRCLHPTQVAGEGPRVFGPAGGAVCVPAAFNANPQKIGSASRPRAALAHEIPHACSNRVGVDDTLDRGLAVGCVGASEGAGGPEASFAGRGPEGEVGHSWQPAQMNGTPSF